MTNQTIPPSMIDDALDYLAEQGGTLAEREDLHPPQGGTLRILCTGEVMWWFARRDGLPMSRRMSPQQADRYARMLRHGAQAGRRPSRPPSFRSPLCVHETSVIDHAIP